MFLLSPYLQKTVKNYQNVLEKGFKDRFTGRNIKKSDIKNTANE